MPANAPAQAKGAFLKFLQEAAVFYGVLATKLQAAYGSVGGLCRPGAIREQFMSQIALHRGN